MLVDCVQHNDTVIWQTVASVTTIFNHEMNFGNISHTILSANYGSEAFVKRCIEFTKFSDANIILGDIAIHIYC